jgi:hypothetical protein
MARMLFFEVAFYFDSTGIEDTDSINPNEKALSDFFMAQMPLSNLNRRSIRAIIIMEAHRISFHYNNAGCRRFRIPPCASMLIILT